jgi:site-specific recombinase XerD
VKKLSLSQACEGLILFKTASGRSHHTIRNYRNAFKKLKIYFSDDPPFAAISRAQLAAFFAWLREDYVSEPDGVAPRGRFKLSPKSVVNIHTNLSALWTWGVREGYVEENIVRAIEKPDIKPPVIKPFTKDEMQAMLKACDNTRTWKNRASTSNRRPTADRDRAILMLLVDTGLRASELCNIRIQDVDTNQQTIKVLGKGSKERFVHFGRRTARALWRYLTPRLQTLEDDDYLFTTWPDDLPDKMNRSALGRLVRRIGDRAGVSGVHPHRFRHTFAINYLRNGGDIFTLKQLLGHSTLEMVERYLALAQADCEEAHRKASPADNWRL